MSQVDFDHKNTVSVNAKQHSFAFWLVGIPVHTNIQKYHPGVVDFFEL